MPKQSDAQEDEFERYLLARGVVSNIPARDETDDEFDKFEPIEVEGEPLSETIIRERAKVPQPVPKFDAGIECHPEQL